MNISIRIAIQRPYILPRPFPRPLKATGSPLSPSTFGWAFSFRPFVILNPLHTFLVGIRCTRLFPGTFTEDTTRRRLCDIACWLYVLEDCYFVSSLCFDEPEDCSGIFSCLFLREEGCSFFVCSDLIF